MAEIQINTKPGGPTQLVVNGVDFSKDTYSGQHGFKVVEVGEGAMAEVGLQVTFAVTRLDLDGEADVQLTDNVPAVAARVRSIAEDVA